MTLLVRIIVEPDGDGFHAYAPALKGLHAGGPTVADAHRRAEKAVKVYIDSLSRHGDPLPIGPGLQIRNEVVGPASSEWKDVAITWNYQDLPVLSLRA